MQGFRGKLIVDDINTISKSEITSNYVVKHPEKFGNLAGFFNNLKNATQIDGFA
jgi:hypothetical protein